MKNKLHKNMDMHAIYFIVATISLLLVVNGQEFNRGLDLRIQCSDLETPEVFNGTVCALSQDNIIDIETRKETDEIDITSNEVVVARGDYSTCQQNCFKDQTCRNFTYFHHTDEVRGIHTYKCILFRKCGNQLKCVTCITGPPAPPRPKDCEKAVMKEIIAEVIGPEKEELLTGEELGRLIKKEMGLYSSTHYSLFSCNITNLNSQVNV